MARESAPDDATRRFSPGDVAIGIVALLAGLAAAHAAGVVVVPLLPDADRPDQGPTGWIVEADGAAVEGAERLVRPDDPLASSASLVAPPNDAPSGPAGGPAARTTSTGATVPSGDGDDGAAGPPNGEVTTQDPVPPVSGTPGGGILGVIYFVDNGHRNASDSNPGTDEEAPWRTMCTPPPPSPPARPCT